MSRVSEACDPGLVTPGELKIGLLGGLRVLVDDVPLAVPRRARKLLICLVLRADDRASWAALGVDDLRRAKHALRGCLGDGWVDPAHGAYRLLQHPWVDVEQIPPDDAEAFEFCCERGELLPESEFAGCDWIEKHRRAYHQRLTAIATRLIDRSSDAAHVEALLSRASRVLPTHDTQMLRAQYTPTPLVASVVDDRVAYLISELESEAEDPETVSQASATATLETVMDEIEARAIARRPCHTELLDRFSALTRLLRPILRANPEPFAWRLANSRKYASNITGAFAELRPWVERPDPSADALCIAGLLNMGAGWPDAAHESFTAGLRRTNSPVLSLMLREKRDILLPWKQGRSPTLSARQLREDPFFEEMNPGGQASIYAAEARTVTSPSAALRIFQTARKIDIAAENPHYELFIARWARRAGQAELARDHLHIFDEMLQSQSAISLHYAQMTVRAEQIEFGQRTPEAQSSPGFRARMQEADALYDAVAAGSLQHGEVSRACSSLLGRGRIALVIGDADGAFSWAHMVRELASSRAEQHLRPAQELEGKVLGQVSRSNRDTISAQVSHTVHSLVDNLPTPLLPFGVRAQ